MTLARAFPGVLLLLAVLGLLAPLVDAQAGATTERISLGVDGAQPDKDVTGAAVDGTGAFIAFQSAATNLVPDDTNGKTDVFVWDRANRTLARASVQASGAPANGDSGAAAISADGRWVAFDSVATNLVPGDSNGRRDVFLQDRITRALVRVSVNATGADGPNTTWGDSSRPDLSADGRYVAFQSTATALTAANDTNRRADVFLYDRATRRNVLVSEGPDGSAANDESSYIAVSGDGRVVAFLSYATNLVAGDTNMKGDIFVRNLTTGATALVSVSKDGGPADAESSAPAVSTDGRVVVFRSKAANLVPDDENNEEDIFVRDLAANTTARVNVASDGKEANENTFPATVSGDGRFVAFASQATNLVPGDKNARWDAFVHDRATGETTRVSVPATGGEGDNHSGEGVVSGDGQYVAFQSFAANLVAGDSNGRADIYLRFRNLPGPGSTDGASTEGGPTGGGPTKGSPGFGFVAPLVLAGLFLAWPWRRR